MPGDLMVRELWKLKVMTSSEAMSDVLCRVGVSKSVVVAAASGDALSRDNWTKLARYLDIPT
jgi:hypothetical protein